MQGLFIIFALVILPWNGAFALRTDQVLPNSTDTVKAFPYKSNTSNKVVLQYQTPIPNGSTLETNYVYVDGSLSKAFPGSITNTYRGDPLPGSFWVQNITIDNSGTASMEICNSSDNILWISEQCTTVANGQSTTTYIGGWGRIIAVEKKYFGQSNRGEASKRNAPGSIADSNGVNSAGYAFMLYNCDCPFSTSSTTGNCSDTKCIPGKSDTSLSYTKNTKKYTSSNNCYVLKQYIEQKASCPNESGCLCSDSSGNSICDNATFLYNGTKTLDARTTNCYTCNANARIAFNECILNVQNAYSEAQNIINGSDPIAKQLVNSLYGSGQYLCGFVGEVSIGANAGIGAGVGAAAGSVVPVIGTALGAIGGAIVGTLMGSTSLSNVYRAGCIKMPVNTQPRFFPRIAMASISTEVIERQSTINLFKTTARVRPFRDIDTLKPSSGGDVCDYGSKELGDNARGTFFKPKITIRFGTNEKIITFMPSVTSNGIVDLTKTYGNTKYDSAQSVISSPWNPWTNGTPIPLPLQKYNGQNCGTSTTQDPNNVAQICTRLEYSTSQDRASYVAYQYKDSSTTNTLSCDQMSSQAGGLINIGRVDRPPLKYTYINGVPNTAISVTSVKTSQSSPTSVTSTITVDPSKVSSLYPTEYHAGIGVMKSSVIPQFYNLINGKLEMGTPCAILFGAKFCVERNLCSALSNITKQTAQNTITSCGSDNTCAGDTKNSTILNLIKTCQKQIYCSSDTPTCNATSSIPLQNSSGSYFIDQTSYQKNIQWSDVTCLTSGFAFASIDLSGQSTSTSTYRFGNYGDATFDTVLSYNGYSDGTPQRAFRSSDITNEDRVDTLLQIPKTILSNFTTSNIYSYLKNTNGSNGNSILQTYLGSSCDETCVSNSTSVRRRTNREMNLCSTNTIGTVSDFITPNLDTIYNIYIPYKCRYIEFQLAGGGGGGYTWYAFGGSYDTRCYDTPGTSGAYISGIIDMFVRNDDYLVLLAGHGAKTFSNNGANVIGLTCSASKYYHGEQPSFIIGANTSTTTTEFASLMNIPSANYAVAGSGQSLGGNTTNYTNGQLMPGGIGTIDQTICSIDDVYGDRSLVGQLINGITTRVGASCGGNPGSPNYLGQQFTCDQNSDSMSINSYISAGGCTGTGRDGACTDLTGATWNKSTGTSPVSMGGDGSGSIQAAKITIDAVKGTVLDPSGQRDQSCTPMCPRINIQTNIGSMTMVCEYGGAMFGNTGSNIVSAYPYDTQIPANRSAVPVKCVDRNGIPVFIDNNASVVSCSSLGLNMVNDDNRFYGLCVNNTNKSSYILEMLGNNGNTFSGSGMYCDETVSIECPTVTNQIINSGLQGAAIQCTQGGFWTDTTGKPIIARFQILPILPITLPITTSLVFKCPTLDPSLVNYDDHFTMGAKWQESNAGTIVYASQCTSGYSQNGNAINMQRQCQYNGTWGKITSTGGNCQKN